MPASNDLHANSWFVKHFRDIGAESFTLFTQSSHQLYLPFTLALFTPEQIGGTLLPHLKTNFHGILLQVRYGPWGMFYTHLGIPGYTGNNKFYGFSRNGN